MFDEDNIMKILLGCNKKDRTYKKLCHEVGPGALLAKVDLKNAFRLCPVRPEDWHLATRNMMERAVLRG